MGPMKTTRCGMPRPSRVEVTATALAMVALASCSDGPSLQERSTEEVRSKVVAARERFERVLRSPAVATTNYPMRAKAAVGDDRYPVTIVASSGQGSSGVIEVVAIVTARAISTANGYYEDFTVRTCVRFDGTPGPTAAATVSDVTCPEIRTAEPADETILVS
jgi:hypothetical protein